MEEDPAMAESFAAPNAGKKADPTPAQRKHSAILERLSNRASKPAVTTTISAPAFESVDSFLQRFSEARKSVEADVDRCIVDHRRNDALSSGPGAKQELENISAAIAELEKLVAENSYFLPSYEVRTALKNVSELRESLEKASAELVPRKRFAFRNKLSGKKHQNPSPEKASDDSTIPDTENLTVQVRDSSAEFRNRQGSIIVKDFRSAGGGNYEGEGDFSLCDLSSCKIYIRGKCRALFIHRIKNCQIFAGPVLSSVLIEDVQNCILVLASHQIRIHHARSTDFYLRVRSRPIIEDSSGVRFAPYSLKYEGIDQELEDSGLAEETGNWENVDDFRWLRSIKSPNWCVLPEEDRSGIVDISEIENSDS